MEMKVIWKLVDTYAAEAWMPTKAEMEQLEKIFSNTLKRILKTPITTPREIVQVETGMWDVETMMQEKQILYLHKILKENDNSIKKSIATNVRNHWHKHICKALEPAKININNLAKMSKSQARTTVKKALNRLQMAKIKTQAQKKSKLGHLLDHQNENTHWYKTTLYGNIKQKSMCEYILSTIKNDKDKKQL